MGCWQRRKGKKVENKQEGGPCNWEESRATGSEALAYLSATDGVSVAQNRRLSSSTQLGQGQGSAVDAAIKASSRTFRVLSGSWINRSGIGEPSGFLKSNTKK